MSPHAVPPSPRSCDDQFNAPELTLHSAGGIVGAGKQSLLQRSDDDEIHELICVGFGPASLAIAVALHDALEEGDPALGTTTPKVRFLEKQAHFAWHAGMLLPGARMQITFVKDLATLRNPQSHFTFLNYLHEHGRLVSFTNLGTFLPQRIEYEDYMRWCAEHFDDVVDYGQDVGAVEVGKTNATTGAVEYFQVRSTDKFTGETSLRKAKHVVVAVGGKPNIPSCLPSNHPRVIHSSQYATHVSKIFPPGSQPRSVAIIGAGQSAAEVFHNIPVRFPGTKSYLLIKGAALRPSDDSPFVNEIFDPEKVDDVFAQDPQVRAAGLSLDKATNYGVVRLELLEEIYSTMYQNRIRYGSEDEWPQRIFTHRSVIGLTDNEATDGSAVRLQVQDDSGAFSAKKESRTETMDVDLVVVASGYKRDAHEEILGSLRDLSPTGDRRFNVNRNYEVQFKKGTVAPDAGIWLQGCNEGTHGLSDTLLSILAVRGGEMVNNLFGTAY